MIHGHKTAPRVCAPAKPAGPVSRVSSLRRINGPLTRVPLYVTAGRGKTRSPSPLPYTELLTARKAELLYTCTVGLRDLTGLPLIK